MPWQWPWKRHDRALWQIGDRAGAGLLPAQVELLAPDRVQVTAEQGHLVIRVDGQEVDPASIWHVKAFTAAGNVVGLSPIAHARQAVGLGLAVEKFGAQWFGEGATPSGVLTSDQRITSEQAADLKERWNARHQGHRGIAVLGDAARFQPVSISPEESQSWRRPARMLPPWRGTSASSPS